MFRYIAKYINLKSQNDLQFWNGESILKELAYLFPSQMREIIRRYCTRQEAMRLNLGKSHLQNFVLKIVTLPHRVCRVLNIFYLFFI